MVQNARILIVDDDHAETEALSSMLGDAGYGEVTTVTDSSLALGTCAETLPDLLLLDLHMPDPDGLELLGQLKPWIRGSSLSIVVLASEISGEERERAVAAGAKEFLSKPLEPAEALLRIRNLLEIRFLQRELRRQNLLLDKEVETRTQDHRKARFEILQRLAVAAEYRDDATGEHGERLGHMSALIAQGLGFPREQVELIRFAAPVHDIGKLGVPESVLQKPSQLTADEYEVMKRHVSIGRLLLGGTDIPILQMAEEIAISHHEWWDGSGYPDGLRGEQIPITGRIVAVADSFDALTHDRPFKPARSADEAVAEILALSERQFDPTVLAVFERLDHATLV